MKNPFSSLFRARDKPQDSVSAAPVFYFGTSGSGKSVTVQSAIQLSTVYACVRVISETVASLPLGVYEAKTEGNEKAQDHPLYRLLHDEPNSEMTSFVFREVMLAHLLLYGNSYSQIIRSGKNQVVGLYPLLPDHMDVDRDSKGNLTYTYTTSDGKTVAIKPKDEKLPLPLKNALDRYLDKCKSHYTARTMDTTRIECSVFLLTLADNGITQTKDINFQVLCSFIEMNLRSKRHSKNILCQYASRMFEYWGTIGLCDSNFAFLLDNQMYPHIGNIEHFPAKTKEKIASLREESWDFPSSDVRDSIPQFVETLEKHGYVGTTLKLANHALTAHYLFLYFNGLGFHPDILWLWFEEVKKTLEISWLHWRRVLSFYLEYTEIGDILPDGKYKYAPTQYDCLPDWCKTPLSAFLERKQNEHRSTGTVRPYRCSCSVFCSFLVQSGISCFSELSAEIINLFINQDSHASFRGISTRFVHLRGFLLFLEEQGYTKKRGLYNCFMSGSAPVEKIVDVLTPEQIARIDSYRAEHNNPIELRDIAIVLLGLKMGFRASDVTHLCFSNIDWKKHEISIVMQKTKVEIKLPMPVDVGNAIYAYLKNGSCTISV